MIHIFGLPIIQSVIEFVVLIWIALEFVLLIKMLQMAFQTDKKIKKITEFAKKLGYDVESGS